MDQVAKGEREDIGASFWQGSESLFCAETYEHVPYRYVLLSAGGEDTGLCKVIVVVRQISCHWRVVGEWGASCPKEEAKTLEEAETERWLAIEFHTERARTDDIILTLCARESDAHRRLCDRCMEIKIRHEREAMRYMQRWKLMLACSASKAFKSRLCREMEQEALVSDLDMLRRAMSMDPPAPYENVCSCISLTEDSTPCVKGSPPKSEFPEWSYDMYSVPMYPIGPYWWRKGGR